MAKDGHHFKRQRPVRLLYIIQGMKRTALSVHLTWARSTDLILELAADVETLDSAVQRINHIPRIHIMEANRLSTGETFI